VGRGFVGDALYRSFKSRGVDLKSYDKFKKIGKVEDVFDTDILFLCLPTPFFEHNGFDKSAILSVCEILHKNNYNGLVVIKSTVEPGTTRQLGERFLLNMAHNPEFLTARTNYEDFDNQEHIMLGKVYDSNLFDKLIVFYSNLYRNAKVSVCSSSESESAKLFLNSFYAAKVQFFNELYQLCNNIDVDFDRVRDLMLLNGWIGKPHTSVPGPDGQTSYGGECFPKDTSALELFMEKNDTMHDVLSAVISERNRQRGG